MKKVIHVEELTVPQAVFASVASVALDNDVDIEIIGADDSEGEEELEVKFSFDKGERDAVYKIKDIISDYEESEEDEED